MPGSAPHRRPKSDQPGARCRSARVGNHSQGRVTKSAHFSYHPPRSTGPSSTPELREETGGKVGGAGAGRPGRARQLADHPGRLARNGLQFDDGPSRVVTSLGDSMDARVTAAYGRIRTGQRRSRRTPYRELMTAGGGSRLGCGRAPVSRRPVQGQDQDISSLQRFRRCLVLAAGGRSAGPGSGLRRRRAGQSWCRRPA